MLQNTCGLQLDYSKCSPSALQFAFPLTMIRKNELQCASAISGKKSGAVVRHLSSKKASIVCPKSCCGWQSLNMRYENTTFSSLISFVWYPLKLILKLLKQLSCYSFETDSNTRFISSVKIRVISGFINIVVEIEVVFPDLRTFCCWCCFLGAVFVSFT